MKSTFFISVHSGRDYNPEDYARTADVLANLMKEALSSENFEAGLAKSKGSITEVQNEIEISLQPTQEGGRELVAECVVDITTDDYRANLEKPFLTKLIKNSKLNEWGDRMRITKKAAD